MDSTKVTFKKNAKSFSFAALFFDRDTYAASHAFYAWCRACDDAIDNAATKDEALRNLNTVKNLTKQAVAGRLAVLTADDKAQVIDGIAVAPFYALQNLVKQYHLEPQYLFELLQGMYWDLIKTSYSDFIELDQYCYYVASTVGLTMCQILGLSRARFESSAYRYAEAMGQAMQLTNIARDVYEDFKMGRVYLPLKLLKQHHLEPVHLFSDDKKLFAVVTDVVARAEELYRVGKLGIVYLPTRAGFAVLLAANLYRAIGRKILRGKNGSQESYFYLRHRAVIPLFHKIGILTLTVIEFIKVRAWVRGVQKV